MFESRICSRIWEHDRKEMIPATGHRDAARDAAAESGAYELTLKEDEANRSGFFGLMD